MEKLLTLHTTFSNLCLRIGKPRIGIRCPSSHSNPAYNTIRKDGLCDAPRTEEGGTKKIPQGANKGNRVMVVVDSTKEAKDALKWALTHVVQKEDSVVLLYVGNPTTTKKDSVCCNEVNPRACQVLSSMKSVCKTKKPGVEVESVTVEGKEKGRLIVEEARLRKASVLILGQKRRGLAVWRLARRWRGKRSSNAVADYCVQNSSCMAIAVRRKSRRLGGYLITTKRHNNFWLLA